MEICYAFTYGLVAIIAVCFYLVRRRMNYWKHRGIPHDEPSILYGNLKGVMKTRHFQDSLTEIYNKYKGIGAPFCGYFFFMRPAAFILDIELIKNILIKDFTNFADRGLFHNEKDDPLTGHLFALDGVKWKQLRHKLSPTFTSGKMKFMFPTVVEVGKEFADVFGKIAKNNSIVEIKECLQRFTIEVIGTCAFGLECNSLTDPTAEFLVMGQRAFTDKRHSNLISGLMQSFPNLAKNIGMREIHEDIHQFFMRIVRETVEYRENNIVERNDFMNLLIDLKNKKTVKTEDGQDLTGLSMEEVAAQAFVFFLAGFETSSTTMGFSLYELAQNQHIQDRVRKEVSEALAKHGNEFTYECMKELPYMDQVLAETLRMYPIVPQLVRTALNDYPVPSNRQFIIKKGVMAIIPVAAIHHDPELYPDPHIFDPERFTPEQMQKRESVAYLAFGDGPRNCIGLRFGKMQSRIGLAFLLKNFKFSVCDKTTIPMVYDNKKFILSSKEGIYLKVDRI